MEDRIHILEKEIQKEKQNELHYKELYITLTENMHIFNKVFKISEWPNEESIKYLLDNYTEQQLYRILDLFNILDSFVFDNFVDDFHMDNQPLNILLNKYEDKCNSLENLKRFIKNKIKNVEKKYDLEFNGFNREYYLYAIFIKDFSKEVNFESFILKNFEDYVYGLVEYSLDDLEYEKGIKINVDDYWEKMSEYDKLNLISITDFSETYSEQLYDEIKEIIEDDFDYYVDIKTPDNPKPISLQTSKYQNRKNNVYEKNIKRYEELITKKKMKNEVPPEVPSCIKKLNNDSSIEDIANCFSQINGFNNWRYDEKDSNKIVFELLSSDGDHILKMKKVEVKKLKKWL